MGKQSVRKVTIEYAREVFAKEGCQLLATDYPGNQLPMSYICSCGNESSIRLADFIRGRRCQQCKGKKNTERLRKKDDELAAFCEQNGCLFVRSFMQDKRTRIEYVCKCGEVAQAYWTNFRNYPNCKKCGNQKVSGPNCYMWDPDRQAVEFRKMFRKRCSNALGRCLIRTQTVKKGTTMEMLGYSAEDLRKHIFEHPEYQKEWGMDFHIDHIFPVQAFLDHGIHDLKLINCLENLRPLQGKDNLSKADKYDEAEFSKWLKDKTHGIHAGCQDR